MEVLFLSTLCSRKKYKEMFAKYGSTTSHASQKFNRLLANGLLANGCGVEALSAVEIPRSASERIAKAKETEAEINYMYLPRCSNTKLNRIMTIWNSFWQIKKWHRKHPKGIVVCDIICGELSFGVWIAHFFLKLKTCALVTDVPSIRAGETRRGMSSLPFRIKNALIYSYDSYIFLTEQMNGVLNLSRKPYVVVEGVVDEAVLETPNSLENKYPEKVCMMAGLLEDVFGVAELLKCFKQIKYDDVKLRFYGKGSAVEEIMEASRVDCRISYCGELPNDEMVAEEKKATLLINPRPPHEEWTAYSFPSKNLEYMASGTPLLAYWLPCIPDEYRNYFYVVDGRVQNAFLTELKRVLSMEKQDLHLFGTRSQTWVVNEKNAVAQTTKITRMLKMLGDE